MATCAAHARLQSYSDCSFCQLAERRCADTQHAVQMLQSMTELQRARAHIILSSAVYQQELQMQQAREAAGMHPHLVRVVLVALAMSWV